MDGVKMLRQGRGEGFRAAVSARAIDDVLACVVDDPRWDRQVESRDDYYASLLVALDADVAIIRAFLLSHEERDESDVWLAIGVLAGMVRRGHSGAASALGDAVRGRWWRGCLDALAAGGEDVVARVVTPAAIAELAPNVSADDLADAVKQVAAPWSRWAVGVPALRFVLEAAPTREPRPMSGPIDWIAAKLHAQVPKAELTGTDADLVALATLDARQRPAAMRLLGQRGYVDFLDDAENFLRRQTADARRDLESNQWRTGCLRYLEALPPAVTLARARAWFSEPWPLRLAAECVLARHATPDDRITMETAGNAALAAGEMYRLCSCVDALATIGMRASLPLLLTIYAEAPYSYARRRVTRALARHVDDPRARAHLIEALWDCEAETRLYSCHALSAGDAPERLNDLAADTLEDDDLRAAARAALARQ